MDRYQTISQAIEDQYQCDITYNSVNNKLQQHSIHPYQIFYFNGGWFTLAYEPIKNDFVYFKLNRMVQVYKTKTHFTKMDFNVDDYLDEFGLKKNGDFYPVELEFTGLNIYIEERTYGKNQELEVIDDSHIILRCEMQNKDMIKSFVLSFGSKCKVLSPDWLKESVQEELIKLMDIYD
ncbi:MAG: WYL domain-containing protein [Acholeplasmatales bacterium]|nr:WYL domain-containing protein [Acholeplasmatales bacterium]